MKIAVVGSRNFSDLNLVKEFVSKLGYNDVVVTGGARGVDSVAERVAKLHGSKPIILYPDYIEHHPKMAPLIRNAEIVELADEVYVFSEHYPLRGGSANVALLAAQAGKLRSVFFPRKDD